MTMQKTQRASLVLGLLFLAAAAAAQDTALDRYVAQRDSVYGWRLVSTIPGEGYRTYVLELTSQQWRTDKDVDHPVWKHWLTITTPGQVRSNKALLFIGGGSNNDLVPSKPSARAELIVNETGSVVAELGMVPNQPLRFTDSPDHPRTEDDIIAYSRVKHFETKDDTWLVRLAMVKSGVRAMDAVQEFLASPAGGRIKIDNFVVAGGSKRGWTTWLVGAVDRRVVAIMPLVIDALNSEAITKHHFEAYGFFSPALKDYVNHGLFPHKIGTPEYRAVLEIEDPYEYRDRRQLRMPKFMINASGDQFFLPDGSQFYYADLPEEKHIRYVPNVKHNLQGGDSTDSMIAFYQAILANKPRPKFSWQKQKDGTLVVTPADQPSEVNLWQATNPEARDFRVDTIGKAYTSTPLQRSKDGTYIGKVKKPAKGFTAFFVELVYRGPGKYPFKFTTEVSVVPDVLPYRWEDAAKKYAATAPGAKPTN
ncbi:MAG TPA: PhoPQ-activated pathogenicity-related family protein [Bryobacteraceae bacterium]|nr:PhoPQ-activated pathogenicity-related family protein [Bryobacteraceae bacterium]